MYLGRAPARLLLCQLLSFCFVRFALKCCQIVNLRQSSSPWRCPLQQTRPQPPFWAGLSPQPPIINVGGLRGPTVVNLLSFFCLFSPFLPPNTSNRNTVTSGQTQKTMPLSPRLHRMNMFTLWRNRWIHQYCSDNKCESMAQRDRSETFLKIRPFWQGKASLLSDIWRHLKHYSIHILFGNSLEFSCYLISIWRFVFFAVESKLRKFWQLVPPLPACLSSRVQQDLPSPESNQVELQFIT